MAWNSIIIEHTCIYGSKVYVFGTHGFSCRRSGGCVPMLIVSRGAPAVLEPVFYMSASTEHSNVFVKVIKWQTIPPLYL